MLEMEGNFRFWLCIYPVVLLMRLFKSFAAQKRLAIVTDTFSVAYNDLMHFFVVFLLLDRNEIHRFVVEVMTFLQKLYIDMV